MWITTNRVVGPHDIMVPLQNKHRWQLSYASASMLAKNTRPRVNMALLLRYILMYTVNKTIRSATFAILIVALRSINIAIYIPVSLNLPYLHLSKFRPYL